MLKMLMAVVVVAAGVMVPASSASDQTGTTAAGEPSCTQRYWRTVARVGVWDGSPTFEVDGEQRSYGRVDQALVRKKCGEAKVVLREGVWELLDPATSVEIGSSEGMVPRCGNKQPWRRALTLPSRDVTPDFTADDGERHYERGERWIVREKCGAYDLKRRTGTWELSD